MFISDSIPKLQVLLKSKAYGYPHRAVNPANSHRFEKLGKAFSQQLTRFHIRASYAL